MMPFISRILIYIAVSLCCVDGELTDDTTNITNFEVKLHHDLFKHYSTDVRPVSDPCDALTINMLMYLLAIDNIDEKKQTITVRVFSEIKWNDSFLVWNKQKYGNVAKINVQTNNIWMPDLSLQNTFDKPTDIGQRDGRAIVTSDGMVTMWPYKILTVGCKINIRNYPFDQQVCTLRFSSWTYDSNSIILKFLGDGMGFRYYQESGEWHLTDTNVLKYITSYGNDTWDHLSFEITLTRKWLFYCINMFLPIVSISLLNVVCFLLPPESGEKIALSISIFLTLTVFLTIVNSSLPESSDEVCILGVYIGLQLVGSGLTILFTVLSLYLFHKKRDGPVPRPLVLLTKTILKRPAPVQDVNGQMNNLNKNEEIQETCHQMHDMPSLYHNNRRLSWALVSSALDRLCLWMSVCWHVILFLSVTIAVQV